MLSGSLLKRNEINDFEWNKFIDNSPQYSIYCKAWYLDSICTNWMAIIVRRGNYWVGIFPLNIGSKMAIRYSIQPIFAQYLGVLYAPLKLKKYKELDAKQKIINTILTYIPKNFSIVDYNFSPNFNYFLPFYWKNYSITPRVSYQLNLERSPKEIFNNYSSRIKDPIKKSLKNNLICFKDKNIDNLIQICSSNKILNKTNCTAFKNLWMQIQKRELGFCLYIKDLEGNIHCGGAFLTYREKMIFILLSTKKEYKKYGSTSFLVNESIKIALENDKYKYYDFEGSMIESVEKYFRGFNPEPITYLNIKRNNVNGFFRIYQKAKTLLS